MSIRSVLTAALVMAATLCSVTAQATAITSSFGTVSGPDNDNQAGPFHGVSYMIITTGSYSNGSVTQGYTASHLLSDTDAAATQVRLSSLSWQSSSSGSGSNAAAYYVSVFSGLSVNSSGTVTSLGTFIGASTNTQTSSPANSTMVWDFAGLLLDVGATYDFVFTTTATPTLVSQVGSNGLEMKTTGTLGTPLLGETTAIGGNVATVTSSAVWEPVFSMTYNTVAPSSQGLPEPSSLALCLAAGLAAGALRARHRR